jgi:hypothetical protein
MFRVMRTIALLTVLALTAPSAGALVCDIACAAQHQNTAAAPQSTSCHDHAAPTPESPALSAWHVCHQMGVVPVSIVRDAAPQLAVAPAIVRAGVDVAPANSAGPGLVAMDRRLTGHAPPPLALPLRF